jgi:hypothetical protein
VKEFTSYPHEIPEIDARHTARKSKEQSNHGLAPPRELP